MYVYYKHKTYTYMPLICKCVYKCICAYTQICIQIYM